MADKPKPTLSDRQEKILRYIFEYVDDWGRPPTFREIGEAVKISSTSVVNYNLNKLVNIGFIERDKEVSRAIRVTDQGLMHLGLTPQKQSVADRMRNLGRMVNETVENGLGRFFQIPMVGEIGASVPVDLGHESITRDEADEIISLGADLISGRPDEMFALRVRGNSMIDAMVNDGDIVILKQITHANTGDMVAVWIEDDGESTLKYYHPEGDMVRLQPANESMQPIYVEAQDVRVQGKVMLVLRNSF